MSEHATEEVVPVTLKKPVTYNDKTYTDLTFREPEVGDLIIGDTFPTGLAKMVAVLASISDVPLPAFKKIKGADFQHIITKTAGILGNVSASTTGG